MSPRLPDLRVPDPGLPELRLPTSALAGIAVVILLLLGLAVIALRAGDDGLAETDPGAAPGLVLDGTESPEDEPDGRTSPAVPDGEADPTEPVDDDLVAGDVALPPGTCIEDDGRAADVSGVEVVDCSVPHSGEVFAATTVDQPPGAPYPGQGVLQGDSQALCQGQAYTDYVGTTYAETRFFVYWLVPTDVSWAEGDREVACIFYDVRGPMTGSQRGSRQ